MPQEWSKYARGGRTFLKMPSIEVFCWGSCEEEAVAAPARGREREDSLSHITQQLVPAKRFIDL